MTDNGRKGPEETRKDQGRAKKIAGTVLFILMQIAVIAYTAFTEFRGGNEANPLELGRHTWHYLLGGVLCLAAALGAESLKYLLMMRTLGEKRSFRAAFETAALGKYYDNVTPFGAGGQPFQIWWMHRRGYSAGASAAMPVTAFLTMQWGFILLAIGIFCAWRSVELEAVRYTAYVGLLFYMAVPCLLITFAVAPALAKRVVSFFIRIGAKIRLVKDPEASLERIMKNMTEFHEDFSLLAGRKKQLLAVLGLSILFQTAVCSLPWFVLMALGSEVSWFEILASTVYIYAAITIIPTPGNSIAAEGSFYLVFSAAGASGVFWAMLIWRFLSYYSFILIGALIHAVDALGTRKRSEGSDRS